MRFTDLRGGRAGRANASVSPVRRATPRIRGGSVNRGNLAAYNSGMSAKVKRAALGCLRESVKYCTLVSLPYTMRYNHI